MIMKIKNEIGSINVSTLLMKNYEIYKNQRIVNNNWIDVLYKEQKKIYKERKQFILTGCIEVVEFENKKYIINGQHRIKVYEKLNKKYKEFGDEIVMIKKYVVKTEKDFSFLFCMSNNTYNENSSLVYLSKKSDDFDHLNRAKNICKEIEKKFPNQSGKNRAPQYDNNTLATLLFEKTQLLYKYDDDVIVEKILDLNLKFGKLLKELDNRQYKNCVDGFYLVYHKKRGCKWITEIV